MYVPVCMNLVNSMLRRLHDIFRREIIPSSISNGPLHMMGPFPHMHMVSFYVARIVLVMSTISEQKQKRFDNKA